ncbi:isoleucine--tRNA ligase [Saccharolobus islandicus]|uniref:isoleucine--tRNA ligase n=1 Tax=Saccharolobus islandicus TaxID=43080 RepID=UPI0009B5B984|nr:isoleucine--tRNA ligase [Sulfolobus islandicus]
MKPLTGNYDPKKIEDEIISFWEENKIYNKLRDIVSKRREKFLFIDGPPYPSSPTPHIGTIWNKVIKDCILRYERLLGKKVHDQPGYDTHGLPIEVATERLLGILNKQEIIDKIGVENFINKCKEFALSNATKMTQNFKDVGVFMDWERPYYTLDPSYISSSWSVIKKAYEKGMLDKGTAVLHWCPRCETTLSDYEVSEYRDLEDPSIYVKFKIKGEENRYLLIWTTTPWTIPSNVFVMVNKDYDYADVEVNGEVLVLAKDRIEAVMKEASITNYKVLRTYKGSELIGVKYKHPLRDFVSAQTKLDDFHQVVDAGNVVTLTDGTGLVHAATGHGEEDFLIGQKYGFPVVMFVNDRGEFTEEGGKYKGLKVRDASKVVINDLKSKNALFFEGKIVHRYPVCWRCKTPLVLRAIDQWFIRVTKIKDEMLKEIENVNWIPDWGKSRISNMVKELRDWVISRQRFWGTPLPIWICEKCNNVIVVGSREDLESIAIDSVPNDLHRPWIDNVRVKCNKCGGVAKRITDVADVWFDSGVAFFASLGKDWQEKWKELGPVDLVLEGHDQLRGWFFSLLRSGLILLDKAPYVSVLVHGFMLDEQGREMHKSLGNYVEPSVVIQRYGRDILRLWLLRNTTWEDARFSWRALELTKRDLQIIWNTYVFASMYMNLDNFEPVKYTLDDVIKYAKIEDLWILSRFNSMLKKVNESMKNYKVHEMANYLINFLVEDVSRFYIRLIRKRAWIEANTQDKIAMYYILYFILKQCIILASTIIPFISEKIYKSFVVNPKESVSMESSINYDERFIDNELERAFEVAREINEASLNARAKAGIKLRWPLAKVYIFVEDEDTLAKVNRIKDVLLSLLNAKDIEISKIEGFKSFSKYKVEPSRSIIGKEYKSMSPKILDYIRNNSDIIAIDILNKKQHVARIDNVDVILNTSHVIISEETIEGYVSSKFAQGIVVISKEISESEEEEGLVRDIIRRIQFMRKQLKLNVVDYIEISIKAPEERVKTIQKWEEFIKSETRGNKVILGDPKGDIVMDWDIEGESYIIGIKKST